MRIAILNGRVLDPKTDLDTKTNIYLADGKIIAIAPGLTDFNADITINADKLIICPGLVDLNANLLSSAIHSERISKQLTMAVKAGITHVAAPAFGAKQCLTPAEIDYFSRCNQHQARIYFIGALTQQLEGNRLNELMLLKEAGCIGFTNGHHPIINNLVKKRCYDYAAMLNLKIFIVANDPTLSNKGSMHQGKMSTELGVTGIPVLSETIALAQELLLIEESGIEAHFYQLSSKKAVEILAQVYHSLPISSDVAIHQLFLTEDDVQLFDGLHHVIPPFRSQLDKIGLREGLKENRVTAISSDHVLLSKENKALPFQDSVPGIASWPLLLPLTLQFAEQEQISLLQAISFITSKPATILGIDAGSISRESCANLVIFDPAERWSLSEDVLKDFGTNNPFMDWSLKGRVKYTIVEGDIAYQSA